MNIERIGPQKLQNRWHKKLGKSRINTSEAHNIVPPTMYWRELTSKTDAELKLLYPQRYQIYLDALRGKRKLEGDVQAEKWLYMMNRLDLHIEKEHKRENRTLKPEQLDVFEDIREHFESGEKQGYIVLPTGVGKTVIFVELAEAFRSRTLIVVPSQELIDQTKDSFHDFAPGMEIGAMYEGEKDLSKQATVTTYDTFLRLIDTHGLDPAAIDLLVLDEGHRALTGLRKKVVERFSGAFILGVTATNAYAEDKQLKDLLKHEIHKMLIREAIERGLLSDTIAALVKTDIDLSQVPIEDGRYNQKQLEKKYNNKGLSQATVDLYKKAHAGEAAIAFCCGVEHAKDLAKEFRAAGIRAAAVWGDMDKDERREILRAFKDGEIDVLTNDSVLKEGFDAPRASVCFNIKPTSSLVDETQRSGRVTRLDKLRPGKLATVYDYIPKKDPRIPQVLFSKILGNAVVLRKHAGESQGGGRSGGGPVLPPPPDIPGVKVVYDVDEVMRVSREYGPKNTPDAIRAALVEKGVTVKDWLKMSWDQRKLIEINGLKLAALARIFSIEGSPLGTSQVFYTLCRAIFGDAEFDRAKQDIRKLEQDSIRAALAAQGATAKDWLKMSWDQRKLIEINSLGLMAVSRIFSIEGKPLRLSEDFINLCRAIFGDAEVGKAIQEIAQTPDTIRATLAAQSITAKDWVNMTVDARTRIEINGLKISAIARVFKIIGRPAASTEVFLNLCRVIFGNEAVDQALQETTPTPESIRAALQEEGITAKDWVNITADVRSLIEVKGLKIRALGTLFHITGSMNNTAVFRQLCRAIFGQVEVDAALREKSQ